MKRSKESTIKSDFEIEEYHASIHEIQHFKKLIEKLEMEYDSECAVKITSPPSYKINSKRVSEVNEQINALKLTCAPIKVGKDVAYEIDFGEPEKMNLRRFVTETQVRGVKQPATIEEFEDSAWEWLATSKTKQPHSLYSINNEMSLFNDSCRWMNLNNFTRDRVAHTQK